MSYARLHSIRTTPSKAIAYITNPSKTENGKYVVSFGCSKDAVQASKDFETVQAVGTGKHQILAKHIILSFKNGEVTPDQALKIGTEFASSLLENEFQYVMAVHNDKDHVHCHFIVNNVNMINGFTFTTLLDKGSVKAWERIEKIGNELSEKYGLSVSRYEQKNKSKSHYEWEMDQKNLSWKSKLRFNLDDLISRSSSFEDFLKRCSESEVEAVYDPDKVISLKFRLRGQQKFTRARTLGWYYEPDQIRKRIKYLSDYDVKSTGIIGSSNKYSGTHFADIRNMQIASEVINLMSKYGISNMEQLEETALSEHTFRAGLVGELNDLQHMIDELGLKISLLNKYTKLKVVYDDYQAVSGVNAKKQFAKKHEKELRSFSDIKSQLIQLSGGKKIDSSEKLSRRREELINLRKQKNLQYQTSKSKSKDYDYCRKALQEYLETERSARESKRTYEER